jgi:flagella basal body P-ring formation protein FlgA
VPAFRIADQTVPLGDVAITPLKPLVYATYVAVPLQIAVNGRVAKTITAGYRVQQYIHTAVAAHDLTPGLLLTADDVTVARVLSNGRPTVDPTVLLGRKIRSATARGAQIFIEQTAVNELVKAGSGAILVVHDGPVALTADVIARTGGGLGESVTVYNAQTNRILSGTVTGPDRLLPIRSTCRDRRRPRPGTRCIWAPIIARRKSVTWSISCSTSTGTPTTRTPPPRRTPTPTR